MTEKKSSSFITAVMKYMEVQYPKASFYCNHKSKQTAWNVGGKKQG